MLDDLADLCRAAAGNPDLLRDPIRIIVPSATLRHHLNTRIVAHTGRAVAGVVVHTLHGFARFVLDAAGTAAPPGNALFPLLVRQAGRDEPGLTILHDLTDGHLSLTGTVSDLLDAGFEEAHAEAVDELLQQSPLADAQRTRVRSVVRVAERTAAFMREHGMGRQATVLALARDLIDSDRSLVRARAILVHGFADATGIATDLIASLLAASESRIYLDSPPDPAAPHAAAGAGFVQRFTERMSGLGVVDQPRAALPAPTLTLLRARGADGEIRAVADRIRLLLDKGIPAERIAIVARSLTSYGVPIRQHCGRLGIPFSAAGVRGPFCPIQRQIAAVLTVLQQREAAPAERWIDALGAPPSHCTSAAWRADIRHALHTVNAARIADIAAASPGAATHGSASKQVARARRLLAELSVTQAAAALVRYWRDWPPVAPFRVHAAHFVRLVANDLALATTVDELLAPALQRLASEIPPAMRLSYDDFLTLIADGLAGAGATELGGHGAGVQVVDVIAARAMTFSHLFLIGLNRDVFPRTVTEDPLMPDPVRRALAPLLPDLPIKQLGFEEERYLFAQLLSASPNVTLVWQLAADDGSTASPSPLVDRLRLSQRQLAVETVPGLYAPPAPPTAIERFDSPVVAPIPHKRRGKKDMRPARSDASDLPLFARLPVAPAALRPAFEHAILAGLYGNRDDVAATLQIALPPLPALAPADAARLQLAVIDQHEMGGNAELGPYCGFVGAARTPTDARQAKLFITTIENVARCPWKTFVRKLLGVEPPPDALESLPAVTNLMLGDIVHRVLDRIVRDAIPNAPIAIAAAGAHAAAEVAWPDAAVLERVLHEEATALAEESGVALPGLIALMVRHARAYVEQARRLDWGQPGATVAIIGSEMTGTVHVEHGSAGRAVHFKADRVDALPNGLRLTDYKTGKAKREALLGRVANGTHLQCAAYALGAGHPRDEGRYLYLAPSADDALRTISVPASDATITRAFHAAAGAVLDIWDTGTFFPRFAEPSGSEFGDCRVCDVRDACLRNDPEYRARFLQWVSSASRAVDDQLSPQARAVLGGWRLRMKARRGEDAAHE